MAVKLEWEIKEVAGVSFLLSCQLTTLMVRITLIPIAILVTPRSRLVNVGLPEEVYPGGR